MNSRITVPVTLDVAKPDVIKVVGLRQGEKNAVELKVRVLANEAQIDAGAYDAAMFYAEKSDGCIAEACTVSPDGLISYVVPASMATSAETVNLAYFELRHGEDVVITTQCITFEVAEGVTLKDAPPTYIPEFDRLKAELEAIVAAANGQKADQQAAWQTQTAKQQSDFTDAESARAAAENARAAAETERLNAERSRATAESTRAAAEIARLSAEQGRAGAEGGRASAESARASTESARANAEASRKASETTRRANETARQTSEAGRVKAESGREVSEAARVTEFGQIRQNAQKIRTVLLAEGQYDPGTRVPAITGEQGVTYYVPSAHPSGGDAYIEWQYLLLSDGSSSWEMMGSSDAVPDAITTADIDSVVADASPSGSRFMALSSLSYWWAKVKAYFAPKSHAASATTYGAASATLYGHAKASQTPPKPNGAAALGTETSTFARGDHAHPLQTSVSGSSGSCTGNAATATRLQTGRALSLAGDASGSAVFDGSANAALTATIANGAVTASKIALGAVAPQNLDRPYSALGAGRALIGSDTDMDALSESGAYRCTGIDQPTRLPGDGSGPWAVDVESIPDKDWSGAVTQVVQRALCIIPMMEFRRSGTVGDASIRWNPWKTLTDRYL